MTTQIVRNDYWFTDSSSGGLFRVL